MGLPPNPGITALFLAGIAKLEWRLHGPVDFGLGTLADASDAHDLILTRDGTWSIVPCAPPGTPSFLLSRETFDVLRGSTLGPQGTLILGGGSYRLQVCVEGIRKGEGRLYAEAVAE